MEYRCYTFGNMYLSSIQQGIQAAHAITEMFAYDEHFGDPAKAVLMEWAREHKTMVCLNAGGSQKLEEIAMALGRPGNELPWATFRESEEALRSIMTCIAIIIPSKIYEIDKDAEFTYLGNLNAYASFGEPSVMLDKFEFELLELLRRRRLAR